MKLGTLKLILETRNLKLGYHFASNGANHANQRLGEPLGPKNKAIRQSRNKEILRDKEV